ncbi:dynactin subunit p25-like [Cryptosporidium ryanae]|uniref:dynactin subunit p25-like n=1 Tax=Cryptosporidium ryanae TaxID=515981 RepID=UPI00351A77E2|nr:dynactin subunit p25-like [Cryptosporidium ryanae]
MEPNCVIRPCFKKVNGKYGSVPINIGDCVRIGENSILMASSIGSNVRIGKNSIIGPGVVIKDNCIIKPDSVITPNTVIPPFTEWGGAPAVLLRRLPESQHVISQQDAIDYYQNFQLVSNKDSENDNREQIQHSNTEYIKSMKTGVSEYVINSEDDKDNHDEDNERKNDNSDCYT